MAEADAGRLKYFFDQITITPFVFVEDDVDINGLAKLELPATSSFFSTKSGGQKEKSKLDPYLLIARVRSVAPLFAAPADPVLLAGPYARSSSQHRVHHPFQEPVLLHRDHLLLRKLVFPSLLQALIPTLG